MICLDSSVWVEIFRGGSRKEAFVKILESAAPVLVPSVCLVEVGRVLHREYGAEGAAVCMASMCEHEVVPLGIEEAKLAVESGLEHRLPFVDSIIYATARRHDATVVTMDADFKGLEGVKYFPKQN